MAVRPTLELGDPLLRQVSQAVADPRDPETQALITDLWDTLHDFRQQHGWGRAMAAPVIGVNQRVLVLLHENREVVLINPRFESWSRTQVAAFETCITFGAIWGEVYRPDRVVVVGLDAQGADLRFEADGNFARMLQHEMDHLDGLVWLDRDPDPVTICTANEYQRQRGET